jgi:hypothetical protein
VLGDKIVAFFAITASIYTAKLALGFASQQLDLTTTASEATVSQVFA